MRMEYWNSGVMERWIVEDVRWKIVNIVEFDSG